MITKDEISYNKNKYWAMMQIPILFASFTFIFSIMSAIIFYSITSLILKSCNFGGLCSIFIRLNNIPVEFFDGTFIALQILLYTFNIKEKMLNINILKISIYYLIFAVIRTIILWNFTSHSGVALYYILDIISSIFILLGSFVTSIIGLKIINIFCLKFLEKREMITNKN